MNGVNPRTFYRHRKRIQEEGEWKPRSRRPKTSPNATPPEIVEHIVRLRAELAPDAGADNIGREWQCRFLPVSCLGRCVKGLSWVFCHGWWGGC
ncbi:leucine zipper domain-containing protein [Saccharopolyspora pogona]|uniref:leucine zipper domain-containing protein n=1 Tax=Saccharopolyspora pogona TaxID=333966 RepID=UPI00295AC865|nr:leucine zipper domain-containing protein [Saccharopolyspora pogona]